MKVHILFELFPTDVSRLYPNVTLQSWSSHSQQSSNTESIRTQLGTFSSVRLLLLGLAVDLTMLLMAEDRVGDWCFCVALHLPVLSAILFLCLSSHFFLPICCLSLILSLLCPKKGVFLAEVRSLMPIGKDAQNVTGRGLREDKFGVRPGKSSKGHPDTFRSHRVVPP